MTTSQQIEALNYFRTHAAYWRLQAEQASATEVNVTQQRNQFVAQVAEDRSGTRTFLDVGCGTGELVYELASRGIESLGVDYAPEMIALAEQRAGDGQHANATFKCGSIFEIPLPPASFDVIAANGFIEYISEREM